MYETRPLNEHERLGLRCPLSSCDQVATVANNQITKVAIQSEVAIVEVEDVKPKRCRRVDCPKEAWATTIRDPNTVAWLREHSPAEVVTEFDEPGSNVISLDHFRLGR